MREHLAPKILISFAVAALGVACFTSATAKPRNWPKAFPESSTEVERYQGRLSRQEFEQQRQLMLTGDDSAVSTYASIMARILWELEPMLAQREQAEQSGDESYREPKAIVGIDPEALIAEYEVKLAELEERVGYLPSMHMWIQVARKECTPVVEFLAMKESCTPSTDIWVPVKRYLELSDAACGEPQSFCRAARDMIVDSHLQYNTMKHCARYIGGDEHEALATFATAEEIEAYDVAKAEDHSDAKILSASYSNSDADAAAYRRQMAEYEANSSQIESISQIKGAGAPQSGNSITFVVERPNWDKVTEPAVLLFRNDCAQEIEFGEADGELRGFANSLMVEPGKWIRGNIRRCGQMRLEIDEQVVEVPTTYAAKVGYVLAEDCKTVKRMTPAEFDAAFAGKSE